LNHQPVCPPTDNFLTAWYNFMKFGNAVQGDLDAIIFNPIASIIILKLLRSTVVR
jgi:hypothetical protein